jgi:hypothetical protein
VGVLIRTVVALTGAPGAVVVVVEEPAAAGVLNADTHCPTDTLAKVAGTVWLKVVVEL